MPLKVNLLSPLNIRTADYHEPLAPIILVQEPNSNVALPELTLNLAQLDNCKIAVPLASSLSVEKLSDIYRQNRICIYGVTLNQQTHSPEFIKDLFQLKVSLIRDVFSSFIQHGLFSQHLWFFAFKKTLEIWLKTKAELTNCFIGNNQETQNYPSYLAITEINNAIEVTYIVKIAWLELSSSCSSTAFLPTPLLPTSLGTGIVIQKIRFSLCAPPLVTDKIMNRYPPTLPCSYLRADVLVADYLMEPGLMTEKFSFSYEPATLEDYPLELLAPISTTSRDGSTLASPLVSAVPSATGSPATPRRTPTPFGTPANTPCRPPVRNPFLQLPKH